MAKKKNEELDKLFNEFNLHEDDVYDHKHYKIITRSGINKIAAQANIEFDFELIGSLTKTELIRPGSEDFKETEVKYEMDMEKEGKPYKKVKSEKATIHVGEEKPKWYTSIAMIATGKMVE